MPVKIFRLPPSSAQRLPCALTIGNFDGVHLGHQALIRAVAADARAAGLATTVLTFEPHPREYFHRLATEQGRPCGQQPVRISTLRDRLDMLASLGVDQTYVLHFNARMTQWQPEDFVRGFLAETLAARHVHVGADFRFGAGRRGDFEMMSSLGTPLDMQVHAIPTIEHEGLRVSSSAIREALAEADFDRAARMLGRPYALSGRVVHGRKLGRNLGFPTLNLRFPYGRPALSGIFVVRVHGLSPEPLPGVASFGTRPAIEAHGEYLLETHLLDWQGDAYGKLIRVEFLQKLRDEAHFPDLDSLTRQIAADTAQARAYFQHDKLP